MESKEKTAAALGFFDGLHTGHQAVISAACDAAKRLGLVPAAFMIRERPELPKFSGRTDVCLIPYDTKVRLLEERFGIRYMYVPFFETIRDMSPEEFFISDIIGRMNAGFVSCGEDFRFGKGGRGDAELLKRLCAEYGVKCEIVPAVCAGGEPVSSTRIRELIRSGDVEAAGRMMIYPPTYTAPVLNGKRIGHKIGFPTINQEIPSYMVHAKRGVYASAVQLVGVFYPAVTNIGTKPTVKSDDRENMETHIIGYDGDLYGRTVGVSLLRYLRNEQKFPDLEGLKNQLISDKKTAEITFSERIASLS